MPTPHFYAIITAGCSSQWMMWHLHKSSLVVFYHWVLKERAQWRYISSGPWLPAGNLLLPSDRVQSFNNTGKHWVNTSSSAKTGRIALNLKATLTLMANSTVQKETPFLFLITAELLGFIVLFMRLPRDFHPLLFDCVCVQCLAQEI